MSDVLNLTYAVIPKADILGRTTKQDMVKDGFFSRRVPYYYLSVVTKYAVFRLYTRNQGERDSWTTQVDAVLMNFDKTVSSNQLV